MPNIISPHPHSEHFYLRLLERLMRAQQQSPPKLKWLLRSLMTLGIISLPLSWYLVPIIGTIGAIGSATLGVLTALTAYVCRFISESVFGSPAKSMTETYRDNPDLVIEGATATFVRKSLHCPKLVIKADSPFKAGYVEGATLAPQIKKSLEKINSLYQLIRPLIGAPKKDSELGEYLKDVEKTLPTRYIQEMQGKIKGYNDWLATNKLPSPQLTYEKYLLIHLLPDAHHYLPFKHAAPLSFPNVGCTSTAIRAGEHLLYTRVLDWPAYEQAGSQFLQIERHIGQIQPVTDIGLPLMSGALTAKNHSGLFIQMNVSRSNKIITPQGMPALFYNRYIAEMAKTTLEAKALIEDVNNPQPLSAYHLQITDGHHVLAMHLKLSKASEGKHVVEFLSQETQSPQLLTVANHGLIWKKGETAIKCKPINHHDSDGRQANILSFFKHNEIQSKLHQISDIETLEKHDKEDVFELLHQLCQSALVSNSESILCVLLIFSRGRMIEARMSSDNFYAPEQPLDSFMNCY